MKTLKNAILTLSFVLLAFLSVKAEIPTSVKKEIKEVLTKYIESSTTGQDHDFNQLLSDDFKQYINCNKEELNYNKDQFINQLKSLRNSEMNCITEYSFMEEKEDFVIAKVDMKFPTFTKTNYVTMSNNGKGWKITSISIHYD